MRLPESPLILVVGGGPAGSVLSLLLARSGREVLVVDRARFPRRKACGECLNPGGVSVLRRLGLLAAVESSARPRLDGWSLHGSPQGPVHASFPAGIEWGLGIRREEFDHLLLEEARAAGVRVEEEVQVVGVDGGPGRPRVTLRRVGSGEKQQLRPRILVGADGLRSVVARSAGALRRPRIPFRASLTWRLSGPPSPGRGSLLLADGWVAGLAPVNRSHTGTGWNLSVVVGGKTRKRRLTEDPGALAGEALRRMERNPAHFGPLGGWSGFLASGPFHWPSRWVARSPILLVGDAAGYFDPLTGQGIFRALRSAELGAHAIDSALRDVEYSSTAQPSALPFRAYGLQHRRAFAPGRRVQRSVDRALANPRLLEFCMGMFRHRPARADALIRVTGDRASPLSLLHPRLWLPEAVCEPWTKR